MQNKLAIGIDLGTTFSCVAVYHNKKVEVISNDDSITNNKTTPSYVAFIDEQILVGEPAKLNCRDSPENVVYDSKRLIGREFNDQTVQEDMKNWPFQVVNKDNQPIIEIKSKNAIRQYTPESVSTEILKKIKQISQRYLGNKLDETPSAVITVPAYFNQSQRQATLDAANAAGLNVLQLINEPTAASIAYGYDNNFNTKKTLLCFDFGGGTLDVSIVSVKSGTFEVLATFGDTHLGGQDIDNALVNHYIRQIYQNNNIDIEKLPNKHEIKCLLKEECEMAKRRLTNNEIAMLKVRKLCKGQNNVDYDLNESISRAQFESITSNILDRTLDTIIFALGIANLKKTEIDEIVMVGGSSRIPYVKNLLHNFFDGKAIQNDIDGDQAIAYGAALYAAKLVGVGDIEHVIIKDILPLSLGVGVNDDELSVVVPKGSCTPLTNKANYFNRYDYQKGVRFEIYEGERPKVSDNIMLGHFTIKIDPCLRHEASIELVFNVNTSGILKIDAIYKNQKQNFEFESRHTAENIKTMLFNAEIFKQEDYNTREKNKVKRQLEDFCYSMKNKALMHTNNNNPYASVQQMQLLVEFLTKTYDWLKINSDCEKTIYEKKLNDCKSRCGRVHLY